MDGSATGRAWPTRARQLAMMLAAALVAAWFLLGVRQAHDLAKATAIAQATSVSPSQARQAGQLLDAAGTLNPDRQVNVTRAELALDLGQRARARRILEAVVRAEPDNLVAWFQITQISGNSYALQARAFRQVLKLEPPLRQR